MAPDWLIPFSSRLSIQNLIKQCDQHLVVLLYHGVNNGAPISFIDPLYPSRSVATFAEDMRFMEAHYEAVNLEEIVSNKGVFAKPSYHVTFDDGLRSVYDLALPVLEECAVKASVYLNNSFIDNRGLFYRYKVALIIDSVDEDQALGKKFTGYQQGDDLNVWLLSLGYEDLELIDKMAQEISLDFSEFLKKEQPYLSSDQIREMQNRGVEFGAHSFDHQLLQQNSSAEKMQQNIKDSIDDIARRFAIKNRAFAFPFTDAEISADAMEAMSAYTAISFGTAGLKIDNVEHHYQRIPMEIGSRSAESILKNVYYYYWMCSKVGKHKMKRG